jgi:hypothetical protein
VGINTSSPWSALDIRTNGSASTGYYGMNLQNPSTAAWSTINLNLATGNHSSVIQSQQNNTSAGTYLFFQTTNSSGALQPAMTLTDQAFLGVFTTSPTERLQLGDQFFLQDGGWKGVTRNMTWSGNQNVRAVDGVSSAMFLTDDGRILFLTAPPGSKGTAPAVNQVTITQSGQVGIGTADTKGYSLAVNGPSVFTKVVVKENAYWPDYVFDKTYKPLPLADLARFIKANHHLPDIPSADSVEASGLDLGVSQAALLKKIEELTLYTISQDEQLEKVRHERDNTRAELKSLRERIDRLERLLEKN